MDRARITEELKELMVEVSTVKEERGKARRGSPFFESVDEIKLETPLAELGMDSIMVTALVTRLEERHEIELSPMIMFEVRTVGDFVDAVEQAMSEAKE